MLVTLRRLIRQMVYKDEKERKKRFRRFKYQDARRLMTRIFLLISTVYTLYNVKQYIDKYTRYQSTTHKRAGPSSGITPPKLMVCLNSMHSLAKVSQPFGPLNFTIQNIHAYYGQSPYLAGFNEKDWRQFLLDEKVQATLMGNLNTNPADFDAVDFLNRTGPRYFLISCRLGKVNCRRQWEARTSLWGKCVYFDTVSFQQQVDKQRQTKETEEETRSVYYEYIMYQFRSLIIRLKNQKRRIQPNTEVQLT